MVSSVPLTPSPAAKDRNVPPVTPYCSLGEKTRAKERLTREIRAEVYLQGPAAKQTVDGPSVVRALVQELLKMNQNIEFIPFSAEDKARIKTMEEFSMDSSFLRRFFLMDQNTTTTSRFGRRPKLTVVTRIRSPLTIDEIKRDNIVDTFLKRNGIWLQSHFFKTPRWATVGILVQKHHFWCLRQPLEREITARVRETLKNQLRKENPLVEVTDDEVDKKMPVIELSAHHNWTRYLNKERLQTDIITIKCDEKDEPLLSELMQKTKLDTREHGTYISMNTSWKNHVAFYHHVKAHMQYMKKIRKVTVVGLYPEILNQIMMNAYSMRNNIMEARNQNGRYLFQGLEENQATVSKGSHFLLFFEEDFDEVMNYVDETLIDLHGQAVENPNIDINQYPADLRIPRRTNKPIPGSEDCFVPDIPEYLQVTETSTTPSKPRKRKTLHTIRSYDNHSPRPANAWVSPPSIITGASSTVTQTTLDDSRAKEMEEKINAQNDEISQLKQAFQEQNKKTDTLTEAVQDVESQLDKHGDTIEKLITTTDKWESKLLRDNQELKSEIREIKESFNSNFQDLFNFLKVTQSEDSIATPETSMLDTSMDELDKENATPAKKSNDPHGEPNHGVPREP